MEGIVWTKLRFHSGKTVNYKAKVGCVELWCRHAKKNVYNNKPCILGWTCCLYIGQRCIDHTAYGEPLKFAKEEGEKLAIKYLLGHGLTIMRALKRTSLLEDVLFEVGIDL